MPDAIIDTLEKSAQALADKYAVTYLELDEQIQKSEQVLSSMIDELTGNEYDMKGLAEFKALLQGMQMSKTEIPSIRFRGFDDDWEQRKLSEITDKVTGEKCQDYNM